ncbi:Protein espinas [Nymphon striatum]|nr:Protein espinas [Nymphon striatum]
MIFGWLKFEAVENTKDNHASNFHDNWCQIVIEEYMQQLPNHKIPRLGSQGEKYRDRQLMLQLPKQDFALAYCKFLEKSNYQSYEDFVNARDDIALDIGYAHDGLEHPMVNSFILCYLLFDHSNPRNANRCQELMEIGDVAVVTSKFGDSTVWHPSCFVCTTCEELLIDLTYCVKDGNVFCERHYAEQLKPRCSACDETTSGLLSRDLHSNRLSEGKRTWWLWLWPCCECEITCDCELFQCLFDYRMILTSIESIMEYKQNMGRDKIATAAQLGKQAHDRKLKLTRNTKMSENQKIFIFETFFKSTYSSVIFQSGPLAVFGGGGALSTLKHPSLATGMMNELKEMLLRDRI